MKEYIERAAVEEMLENAQLISDGEYCGYCTEDVNLGSIPAADVAEVRHGKIIETIKDGKMNRVFSCCGHDFTELTCWYMPKYCPHCGAPIADEAVEMVLKRMEEIYK